MIPTSSHDYRLPLDGLPIEGWDLSWSCALEQVPPAALLIFTFLVASRLRPIWEQCDPYRVLPRLLDLERGALSLPPGVVQENFVPESTNMEEL